MPESVSRARGAWRSSRIRWSWRIADVLRPEIDGARRHCLGARISGPSSLLDRSPTVIYSATTSLNEVTVGRPDHDEVSFVKLGWLIGLCAVFGLAVGSFSMSSSTGCHVRSPSCRPLPPARHAAHGSAAPGQHPDRLLAPPPRPVPALPHGDIGALSARRGVVRRAVRRARRPFRIPLGSAGLLGVVRGAAGALVHRRRAPVAPEGGRVPPHDAGGGAPVAGGGRDRPMARSGSRGRLRRRMVRPSSTPCS